MITASRGIVTLDDLRDHLQYAIGLELTTIPAYLCALYSVVPGASTAACEVIQGVVLEKMLHMALAANILNAVGGAPATGPAGGGPGPVPVYPARVPFIGALPVIRLRAFSPAARAGCQLTAENYCGGAGPLIEVTDLDSALAAIGEIAREGDGVPLPGGGTTGSRHARFAEIRAGRYYRPGQVAGDVPAGDILPVDWRAVQPMAPDPAAHAYHGTWAYQPMMAFNAAYTALVDTIYRGFNGEPMLLREAVPGMYELKYQATSLLNLPSPAEPGRTLGPAFEYLSLPRQNVAALVYPQRRGAESGDATERQVVSGPR
jgi:hypothetical protein